MTNLQRHMILKQGNVEKYRVVGEVCRYGKPSSERRHVPENWRHDAENIE